MLLMTGMHRESGGFTDNYWYCRERECDCVLPARNREEAERETYFQLHASEIAEKIKINRQA